MSQLVEENKSLWRIQRDYLTESKECEKCTALWEDMIESKKEYIQRLEDLIKLHMSK